eukprot:COSAG01_NODE_5788_length_4034_cov_1.990597_7_plen_58_part_00
MLVSPYTSVRELAQHHGLPSLATWLLTERYPTDSEVSAATVISVLNGQKSVGRGISL